MFIVFGIVALTMATIGLYAVTAYSVAQRMREFGVRVALGAGAGHVWWLVASRASRQLLIGLAIGVAGAFTVTRVLPREITRSDGVDPSLLLLVVGILALARHECVRHPGATSIVRRSVADTARGIAAQFGVLKVEEVSTENFR